MHLLGHCYVLNKIMPHSCCILSSAYDTISVLPSPVDLKSGLQGQADPGSFPHSCATLSKPLHPPVRPQSHTSQHTLTMSVVSWIPPVVGVNLVWGRVDFDVAFFHVDFLSGHDSVTNTFLLGGAKEQSRLHLSAFAGTVSALCRLWVPVWTPRPSTLPAGGLPWHHCAQSPYRNQRCNQASPLWLGRLPLAGGVYSSWGCFLHGRPEYFLSGKKLKFKKPHSRGDMPLARALAWNVFKGCVCTLRMVRVSAMPISMSLPGSETGFIRPPCLLRPFQWSLLSSSLCCPGHPLL